MAETIPIAVIGTGLIVSGRHWPALSELSDDFRVIALVNRTPAKAEVLASTVEAATGHRPTVYAGYAEMLAREKPAAVSLALPPALNPEVTEAGLSAGCHVIAEKPIAANLSDATRMLPWSAQYGRVLMIAENVRYFATQRRAAQLIADSAIGEPRAASWFLYPHVGPESPYYHTDWRLQPEHPGGYISDGGVHHMAAFRMLVGEVEAVTAQVASLRSDLRPIDTITAALHFASGAVATYGATYALRGPESALQVAGSEGVVLVWRTAVELWRGGKPLQRWDEPSQQDGMIPMYQDFARAIRSGRPPNSTAAEGWADLRLIVALLRAAQTGRRVSIADVR